MDMAWKLYFSIVFGIIGSGYFMLGKKRQRFTLMVAGVILCIYPYFVPNGYLMAAIGVILTVAPLIIRV